MALYPRTKKSLKCPAKALSRIQNEPILFTESFQIIELFLQLRVLHASSMKLYSQFVFELNVECACSLTLWSLWQENYSNQHQRSVGVTKNGNLVKKKRICDRLLLCIGRLKLDFDVCVFLHPVKSNHLQ